MFVTSADCKSFKISSGKVVFPVISKFISPIFERSGIFTSLSLSFMFGSFFISSTVFEILFASWVNAASASGCGNIFMRLSCAVSPAFAKKPIIIAGAIVVPIERMRDRVASAEFESSGFVFESII